MVGIKKALSLYSERMTVALRGGIPPFVNRGQRYDKIPKPARDSGIFFIELFQKALEIVVERLFCIQQLFDKVVFFKKELADVVFLQNHIKRLIVYLHSNLCQSLCQLLNIFFSYLSPEVGRICFNSRIRDNRNDWQRNIKTVDFKFNSGIVPQFE